MVLFLDQAGTVGRGDVSCSISSKCGLHMCLIELYSVRNKLSWRRTQTQLRKVSVSVIFYITYPRSITGLGAWVGGVGGSTLDVLAVRRQR